MTAVFDTNLSPSAAWPFTAATPSTYLYATRLPLPPAPANLIIPKSTHDAKYWAKVTKGLDLSDADLVDGVQYNRILWKGIMGNKPYPASLSGPLLRRKHDADDDDKPAAGRAQTKHSSSGAPVISH